jgi:hypothetical protein
MTRIDPNVLNCALYLYPSTEAAAKGEKAGGSGFVTAVPSAVDPKTVFYPYAVTNRHVIEDGHASVVRLNTTGDDFDILPIDPREWVTHPDGDDVAACALGLADTHKVSFVSTNLFLTKEDSTKTVGVGNDVFTVGRFMSHEGLQKNQPAVRFGNIAMMPGDPIEQPNGHRQVSYLIEGHSVSGYSGSPVFVDMAYMLYGPGPMRLLGVLWGHLPDVQPVFKSGLRHPEGWVVKGNSGMMGVVPAWMLRDLLDEPRFRDARRAGDVRLSRERETRDQT